VAIEILGLSYKVFNVAISTQKYMLYHLLFPAGVLEDGIKNIFVT
jgi:hypothetical protein